MALSGDVVPPGQGWPTHLPGLMGPALAAFVVTAVRDGRAGLAELWSRVLRWRVHLIWYALILVTALMVLIPVITGGSLHGVDRYSGAPTVGVAVFAYALVVNGFGEEIGWRGFLADRLLGRYNRIGTAVIVWLIWGTWHLPMFWVVGNFRDLGIGGTIGWMVGLLFGSVFLTWLYQSAARSILIVALWHTTYNFTTATDAARGTGAAVSSTVVIVATVAILFLRSSWRSPVRRGEPTQEAAA
jgi:uncharacterized protein